MEIGSGLNIQALDIPQVLFNFEEESQLLLLTPFIITLRASQAIIAHFEKDVATISASIIWALANIISLL